MIRFFLLVLTYNFCLVKSQTLPPPPGLPPVPSPPGLPPVSPPPGLPPVDILVKGQTLPPPGLPPVDAFLSWLFNAASNEIDNIGNNFDFHEVSPKDITFVLYLPPNADKTVILNPENLTFIDPSKPTKIMIHGWQASGLDDSNKVMARKYHQNGDYNFIAVDWSEHAKKVYMHSAGSTKDIGHILGNFIYKLIKKDAKFLPNIHLLGVSLGGHVAGFAGKKIQELTGKKIGRITGLDVASPLFEMPTRRSSKNRLSEYDAEFVDVIHTNAGFLGVSDAIGTADFYVENGGPMQPGCFDPLNMVESFSCSHFKAVEYFMESIDGKKFEALSCPNSIEYHILACNGNKKVIMGERVSRSARGPFYLEKESPLPYGKLLDNPLGIKINTPKFRIPFVN